MRGNLVQIAVAFVIATAFATVVIAFVGFIMSIVSKLAGGPPNLDNMPPTQDIALLQEIRDLLAARDRAGTGV